MLVTRKQKDRRIWFDDSLCQSATEHYFSADYWQRQGAVFGYASGRGKTWFINMPTVKAALRHYRRGGLFGKLVKDHYFFTSWEKTRGYQELMLLFHLRDSGVNVPRPIAAQAVRKTFCYQADLLSEKIANARDLVSILQEQALSDEMYLNIGQEIRKLHDAQVNHTDLNIHNILIDEQEQVWIIDFDKCYIQPGDDWKLKNLERLRRSFDKEVKQKQILFEQSGWNALLSGYSD